MSSLTNDGYSANAAEPAPRRATVLQVLPALETGGVERGTVEIAEALVQRGATALVASSGGRMVHELQRVRAEHVVMPLQSKNPLKIRANAARLHRLVRDRQVDLVHARSRAPAWSALSAARRAGVPFLTTFHGTYNIGNPLKRWYNSVMVRGDRVIAISHHIARHIEEKYGVGADRVRVIHRGVDLRRFDPERTHPPRIIELATKWRIPDGMPVILLPARLTAWKGQMVLVRALAELGRRDVRCLLVGSDQGRADYRAKLEALIADLNLGPVAHIVDDCRDMPAAFMLSDVVVSASTDPEAFGRVMAEAQAMGRPVIGTDHGGAREIIAAGETGWLTRPGDPRALAGALREALALSGEARQSMAAKAIQRARTLFSLERMCAETFQVYDEVLGARAR